MNQDTSCLKKLLNNHNINTLKDQNGRFYIRVTDSIKDTLPFDMISNDYKINKGRRSTIYLNEILTTLRDKKGIRSTTKANTYTIIDFFKVINRITVDEDTFIVNDPDSLLRGEDKFSYRLIQNLK